MSPLKVFLVFTLLLVSVLSDLSDQAKDEDSATSMEVHVGHRPLQAGGSVARGLLRTESTQQIVRGDRPLPGWLLRATRGVATEHAINTQQAGDGNRPLPGSLSRASGGVATEHAINTQQAGDGNRPPPGSLSRASGDKVNGHLRRTVRQADLHYNEWLRAQQRLDPEGYYVTGTWPREPFRSQWRQGSGYAVKFKCPLKNYWLADQLQQNSMGCDPAFEEESWLDPPRGRWRAGVWSSQT